MILHYLSLTIILFRLVYTIKIGPFQVKDVRFDDGQREVITSDEFHKTIKSITENRKRSESAHEHSRKRRDVLEFLENKIGTSSYTVIGPRCIPLLSMNVNANPYHPSLLSLPGSQLRYGLGLPSILPLNPISCPGDAIESCRLVVSKSVSVSVTNSYSISMGGSETYSKSIGKSDSKGKSNSYTKSIGKTVEKSFSLANTHAEDDTIANTLSQAIHNTHEASSGISRARTSETSETNTYTQDTTNTNTITSELLISKSLSNEITNSQGKGGSAGSLKGGSKESSQSKSYGKSATVNAGVQAKIFNFGVSGTLSSEETKTESNSENWSETKESNWNNLYSNTIGSTSSKSASSGESSAFSIGIGRSNAKTQSFSDSATTDNRVSDSISVTREAARTKTRTESNSQTDSISNSDSYRIDDSFASTDDTSISNALNEDNTTSRTFGNETSHSETITTTLQQDMTFPVAPGTCKIAVCFPFVKSIAIPFECLDLDGANNIVNVEYMIPDIINERISCTFGLIDCDERDQAGIFLVDSVEFKTSSLENSLEYGSVRTGEDLLVLSKNERYTLSFGKKGNLILRHLDLIIWDNEMGIFEGYQDLRLRINEKGHLVQEVKELFNKTTATYRSNEWITVWSSMPINLNTTVGVPILPGAYAGYKLILENNGELTLFDAVGTVIWCPTKQKAQHAKGYKFPEVYLLPTNMITPEDFDRHNSIDDTVKYRTDLNDSFYSLDSTCSTYFGPNDALLSNNGRYKVILEESGNLLIKDGTRTMWESSSANLPYARRPYQLVLSPSGELMILDVNLHMVWKSISYVANTTRPYKLSVLDEGRVVITDLNGTETWESWPMRSMSKSVTFFTRFQYRFVPCHGEGSANKSVLVSNSNNTLDNNQHLVSKNRLWDLYLWGFNKLDIRYILDSHETIYYNASSKIRHLLLNFDGTLLLKDINNVTVLKLGRGFSSSIGPFSCFIRDDGNITVIDKNKTYLWSYPIDVKSKLVSNEDNKLENNQLLTSNNGVWDLFFWKSHKLEIRYDMNAYETIYNNSTIILKELILNVDSTLLLKDINNVTVLKLGRGFSSSIGPFSCFLLDDGKITVIDKNKKYLWSYPIDVKSKLVSNEDNKLENNQLLTSNNGVWDLSLSENQLVIRKNEIINTFLCIKTTNFLNNLVLKNNGILALLDSSITEVFKVGSGISTSNGPFTLTLSNTGVLTVVDKNAVNVWSYPYFEGNIFEDQFNSDFLELTKWNTATCQVTSRGRLQQYSINEVSQASGVLKIRGQKSVNGSNVLYTTGRLDTRNKFDFLYGEIEWSVKMPFGQGWWGSIGLSEYINNTPAETFIQIRDDFINQTSAVYLNIIVRSQILTSRTYVPLNSEILTIDTYRKFKLIWEPSYLAFYVNGELIMSTCDVNKVPNTKMFLTIDLSIGEDYPANSSASTPFSANMYVDYVTVKRLVSNSTRVIKTFNEINYNMRLANHIKITSDTSALNCHNTCKITPNCVASTYSTPTWCYLFDEKYTSSNENDWKSTFSRCQEIAEIYQHNDVRLLNEILKQTSNSKEDCWNLCKTNQNCIATTFKGTDCYLFDSNFQFEKHLGWISYLYKRLDITNGIYQRRVRLLYYFTHFLDTNSIDDCWSRCTTYSQCTAVSFSLLSNPKCYLYNSTYGVSYDSEYNTIATNLINK